MRCNLNPLVKPERNDPLKPKVYLAGPFFSPEQLDLITRCENALESTGWDVYSPRKGRYALEMNKAISNKEPTSDSLRTKVFTSNVINIDDAKLVVAIIDGRDTGCFRGDTKIALASGEDVPIKDLVGKPCYVYSVDPQSGSIVPGYSEGSKLTKRNTPLVEVLLDSGDNIVCTPDHPFLLRKDASHVEAKDLRPGTSLLPLYRKLGSKGYELALDFSGGLSTRGAWRATHKIMAGQKPSHLNDRQTCIHHADFNKRNNSPDNLKWMYSDDHIALHASHNDILWSRDDFRKMRSEFARDQMKSRWRNSEFRDFMSNVNYISCLDRNDRLWCDPKFVSMQRVKMSKQSKEYWASNYDEMRAKIAFANRVKNAEPSFQAKALASRKLKQCERVLERILTLGLDINRYTWDSAKKFYGDQYPTYTTACKVLPDICVSPDNHKVVSVRDAGTGDVYGMQVDPIHNYALSSGVFVSNTVWEMGYAFSSETPILTITDKNYGMNLMLAHCIIGHTKSIDELKEASTLAHDWLHTHDSESFKKLQSKFMSTVALKEGPSEHKE